MSVALKEITKGMNIAMIAAMDKNRIIGADNDMPWHLPDDLKFFKANTVNKPVIMGRKTFESIGSKPLPKRRNLIITRNVDYAVSGAEVFHTVEEALHSCKSEAEIIIMGGGQLYAQMMPFANKLYVTLVDVEVTGDTVFPEWLASEWQEVSKERHDKDERHAYAFEFITLIRKTP
ncbi:Dihydrofolate reductase type 3 [Hydrogenovibrio crunogenus]|uniref:Dihydrofolate reductase n=1 Tax=Hydrogenovibrio crunogenus TaxID=39765 RepID=A0A4P7NY84_9GAMM|nr:type 3 dihydrofolate reductase [Hydrogenovibrio crunogenus]QBZ82578.1 Dihydrofolate reductase type 3 [Hydrogenovibrio crunogenus]